MDDELHPLRTAKAPTLDGSMTDPWLKVYAADMRGEPDMALLGLTGQALLIHAWDISRQEPTYGELRMKSGRPYTPSEFAAVVPGATVRAVTMWWHAILEHEYAEEAGDGALTFPKLAKRQIGSNALRQKRHRERHGSNAPRNAARNASPNAKSVTRSKKPEARKPLRPPDVVEHAARPSRDDVEQVWAEYRDRHPRAVLTTARRQLIQRRLADYAWTALIAAIRGNHLDPHCNGDNDRGQTYHDLELILRDAAHIERYEAIAEESRNGGGPSREEMDALTAEAARRGLT